MAKKIRVTHPAQLSAFTLTPRDNPEQKLDLELVLLQPLENSEFLPSSHHRAIDLKPLSKRWRAHWAMPSDRVQSITFNTRLPESSSHEDPTLCRKLYWDSTAPSPADLESSNEKIAVVESRDFLNLAILLASIMNMRCKRRRAQVGGHQVRFEVVHEPPGMMNGAVNDMRMYMNALLKS